MEKQIPFKFEVQFGESFTPVQEDPTLRRGKVRVFYKGLNRNYSYITDSFAQQLINSADYKPIVGTYLYSQKDFGGHEESTDKRAYGVIVPNSCVWEDHLDSDGVKRSYATFDVIIWTEYWDEAKDIFTKAQSMELDKNSIKGAWKDIIYNDFEDQAFVYSEGVMKGLCVLGSERTPCFQGASFFDFDDNSDYKKFTYAMQKYFNGGKDAMEEVKNTSVEATEETEVVTEHTAEEPEAEASVPAENEVVAEPEAAEEVTEAPAEAEAEPAAEPAVAAEPEEAPALEAEHEATAEPATEEPGAEAEANDFEAQLNKLMEAYNTLQEQFNVLQNDFNTLKSNYEQLSGEKQTLNKCYESLKQDAANTNEKLISCSARLENYEKKEKEELLTKFSKCLPAAALQQISEIADELSIEDLNARLALEYTSFSMAKEQNEDIRIPQVHAADEPTSAFAQLLSRYKK